MTFLEYGKIINYSEDKIGYFINHEPNLLNETFIVQHKYDGSNFQIIFEKNSDKRTFASRNCVLEEKVKFNDFQTILKRDKYKILIDNVQKYLNESDNLNQINLYGELYGKVFNRVRYSEKAENQIIFFDALFDLKLLPQQSFIEWSQKMEIPIVETFFIGKFSDCVKFDVSKIKTSFGDLIEGVVIKTYDKTLVHDDNIFYFKIKNDEFCEKMSQKEVKSPKEEKTNVLTDNEFFKSLKENDKTMLLEFQCYINANRLKSVFSKKAWLKNEIQILANELLKDAHIDFKIDNQDANLDETFLKNVFMKDIFKLIKDENLFNKKKD
jgi:hypothetical protein